MRSISQVAKLTGVSVRALQYYDEIGLLKPSELTPSGYRLYDENALQSLQQILFFKELGFKLKEIRDILQKPGFDRIAAFRKQRELLLLKRNRTDRLIQLLSRLEKGEQCMSFKEFDLSEYIDALEEFKSNQTQEVVRYWGSIENFEMFIQKIRDDEAHLAKLAICQYGSVEKYTEAMRHNLEHFSEIMNNRYSQIPEEMKVDDKFQRLASHRGEDDASDSIQDLVKDIIAYAHRNAPSEIVGDAGNYCRMIIELYSNDYLKAVTDSKYGTGSCDYIADAFRCYLDSGATESY